MFGNKQCITSKSYLMALLGGSYCHLHRIRFGLKHNKVFININHLLLDVIISDHMKALLEGEVKTSLVPDLK